jgi:hypothetical protein
MPDPSCLQTAPPQAGMSAKVGAAQTSTSAFGIPCVPSQLLLHIVTASFGSDDMI